MPASRCCEGPAPNRKKTDALPRRIPKAMRASCRRWIFLYIYSKVALRSVGQPLLFLFGIFAAHLPFLLFDHALVAVDGRTHLLPGGKTAMPQGIARRSASPFAFVSGTTGQKTLQRAGTGMPEFSFQRACSVMIVRFYHGWQGCGADIPQVFIVIYGKIQYNSFE